MIAIERRYIKTVQLMAEYEGYLLQYKHYGEDGKLIAQYDVWVRTGDEVNYVEWVSLDQEWRILVWDVEQSEELKWYPVEED